MAFVRLSAFGQAEPNFKFTDKIHATVIIAGKLGCQEAGKKNGWEAGRLESQEANKDSRQKSLKEMKRIVLESLWSL
jgi:hypothetical protein